MNSRTKINPGPRPTEAVAFDTLGGLIVELLQLRRSKDPLAWGRVAQIGQEIQTIGSIVETELLRREAMPPAEPVSLQGIQWFCCGRRA